MRPWRGVPGTDGKEHAATRRWGGWHSTGTTSSRTALISEGHLSRHFAPRSQETQAISDSARASTEHNPNPYPVHPKRSVIHDRTATPSRPQPPPPQAHATAMPTRASSDKQLCDVARPLSGAGASCGASPKPDQTSAVADSRRDLQPRDALHRPASGPLFEAASSRSCSATPPSPISRGAVRGPAFASGRSCLRRCPCVGG
jgi:hypothetical protein